MEPAAIAGASCITEPDPVARAVHEQVCEAGVLERVATGAVDLLRRSRPAAARARRPVAPRARRRGGRAAPGAAYAPDAQRPRHVRAVAVDLGPEVDDDELACGDAPVRRLVVRQGAVRPGWPRSSRTRRGRRPAGASRSRAPGRTAARSSSLFSCSLTCASPMSAMSAASSMRASSPASFTIRRRSRRPRASAPGRRRQPTHRSHAARRC